MNNEKMLTAQTLSLPGIIRAVLTLAGSFLIGKTIPFLHGVNVDVSLWNDFGGVVLVLASVVMAIKEKTVREEKIEGALRQLFTFVFGILITAGILTSVQAFAFIGTSGVIAQQIYNYYSRRKSIRLYNKEITPKQLHGVEKELKK